jgi:hypothetical protein
MPRLGPVVYITGVYKDGNVFKLWISKIIGTNYNYPSVTFVILLDPEQQKIPGRKQKYLKKAL